jgi:RNA polymerase sigma factor (sigma-70 family)
MWQQDASKTSRDVQLLRERIEVVLNQMQGETKFASPDEESSTLHTPLLEMVIQRYYHPLSAYTFRLLSDYDAAQDIVQDTWIALYRSMQQQPSSWLKNANIPSLLWTVAKRKAINYIKTRQRISSYDSENIPSSFEPHIPPFDYPENTAIRDEVCLALYQAVNALNKPQRTVIALRFFYDYRLEDIASTLQMPLSTVKSHLRRGQQYLRKLLVTSSVVHDDLGLWEKTQETFPKTILRE